MLANKRKKNRGKKMIKIIVPGHIPMIKSNIIINHRFRFTARVNITNINISSNNFVYCMGVVATATNATGFAIAQTFRIKRIQVWSAVPAIGSATTCSLEWTDQKSSSSLLSSKEMSDTSLNVSSPAYISGSPPKSSLASFWNSAAAQQLFTLNCPANSVIDVDLQYILLDDLPQINQYNFVSGVATIGMLYYIGMDATTNSFVPVSLTPNF